MGIAKMVLSTPIQEREARNGIHPTKDELIGTVVKLLDHFTLDDRTDDPRTYPSQCR